MCSWAANGAARAASSIVVASLGEIQGRMVEIGPNVDQVMTARHFGVGQAARFGAEDDRRGTGRQRLHNLRGDLIWGDHRLPAKQSADTRRGADDENAIADTIAKLLHDAGVVEQVLRMGGEQSTARVLGVCFRRNQNKL
jgi:hypothetical protein